MKQEAPEHKESKNLRFASLDGKKRAVCCQCWTVRYLARVGKGFGWFDAKPARLPTQLPMQLHAASSAKCSLAVKRTQFADTYDTFMRATSTVILLADFGPLGWHRPAAVPSR